MWHAPPGARLAEGGALGPKPAGSAGASARSPGSGPAPSGARRPSRSAKGGRRRLTTQVSSAGTARTSQAPASPRAAPGTHVHGPPGSANSFAPQGAHAPALAFACAFACVFAGHTHACACATSPGAHGAHAPSPTSGFTLSAGHARQRSPARKLPGAHAHAPLAAPLASLPAPLASLPAPLASLPAPLASLPAPLASLPAPVSALAARAKPLAHTEQLETFRPPATSDVARNGHAVHAAAPAGANEPAAHAAQALAPAAAKLPAAQASQALALADAAKLPAAHALQALAPAAA